MWPPLSRHTMHIHLDTVGGISGNMFVGALLELWPESRTALPHQMALAGFADLVTLKTETKHDGVLSGTYFTVMDNSAVKVGDDSTDLSSHSHHQQDHAHRHFRDIRQTLEDSALTASVKAIALGIFTHLAQAEAKAHSIDVDSVAFHEVGAWDSIADIVCAAYLIDKAGSATWSVSSLPMGNGRVQCAHGAMPLPAPAVTLLLQGFEFHNDGLQGERITPTGAAILRYLQPRQVNNNIPVSTGENYPQRLTLLRSGFGFGSRSFPGISNVLRIILFATQKASNAQTDADPATANQLWQRDQVLQINFEVDDQTPEDLAIGLDNLRETEGVIDVMQTTAFGKKGRLCLSVRVLANPAFENDVIAGCFEQTATIGLRLQMIDRAVLTRKDIQRTHGAQSYTVKQAVRPVQGVTEKVAMDELARPGHGYRQRQQLREAIEKAKVTNESTAVSTTNATEQHD